MAEASGGHRVDSDRARGSSPATVVAVARVTTIASEVARREVRFSGVTRAARHAVLSFVVPARMVKRPVEVGDRVKKGQMVAQLDERELKNAATRARAEAAEMKVRIEQAVRDQHRLERLSKSRAEAIKDFEQAAARIRKPGPFPEIINRSWSIWFFQLSSLLYLSEQIVAYKIN